MSALFEFRSLQFSLTWKQVWRLAKLSKKRKRNPFIAFSAAPVLVYYCCSARVIFKIKLSYVIIGLCCVDSLFPLEDHGVGLFCLNDCTQTYWIIQPQREGWNTMPPNIQGIVYKAKSSRTKNKSCPPKKSYVRLSDIVLCNFADSVIKFPLHKTKFILCPPNQGAEKAAVSSSCSLFIWYLVEPLIMLALYNLCTSKQLYMKVISKLGSAQTGGLTFFYFSLLWWWKYVKLQSIFTEDASINMHLSTSCHWLKWSNWVKIFERCQRCWVDLMVKCWSLMPVAS